MHEVLEKARGKLILQNPFISCILLSTNVEECDTPELKAKFPTAATDGDNIWINMDFIESLAPKDERKQISYCKTILAHEVQHIALMHPFRRENRDAVVMDMKGNMVTVWNLACDGPVNEMLDQDSFELPPGCFRYKDAENMSAEELYNKLLKQAKKQTPCISIGDSLDHPSTGDPKDQSEGGESKTRAEAEMRAKIKVQKALDVAKACGNVPASLQRMIGEALESKIPWQELLRQAVTSVMKKEDYTWNKLNRRHIHNDMYFPSMDGNQTGEIFLAFDTSGSVGGAELSAFLGEMNSIFEDVNPEKIHVGFCDCEFYAPHTELTEDDLPMNAKQFSKITKGGGGTAFKPVFDYIRKKNLKPEMIIYFTDLYGSDFGKDPGIPTLWVSTQATDAPFGQVIKLEL